MKGTHEDPGPRAADDLPERPIGRVIGVSVVVMVLALAVSWALLDRWGAPARAGEPRPAPATIGMLEQTLILDTARGIELRTTQTRSLREWGWIDRDAGVARIPIDVAIDVLAEAPLPPDRPVAAMDSRGGEP